MNYINNNSIFIRLYEPENRRTYKDDGQYVIAGSALEIEIGALKCSDEMLLSFSTSTGASDIVKIDYSYQSLSD